MVAGWMHMVAGWMHMVAGWMHMVADWMHMVAGWMHMVAGWMHLVAGASSWGCRVRLTMSSASGMSIIGPVLMSTLAPSTAVPGCSK